MNEPSQSARDAAADYLSHGKSHETDYHRQIRSGQFDHPLTYAIAQAEARGQKIGEAIGREAGLREAATAIRECSAALNDGGLASQLVTNFCVSMATGLEALINKDQADE